MTARQRQVLPPHAPATPPAPDEVEVTILGHGRGECVLVHLGGGQWMIVDSFGNKKSTHPALGYLQELAVPAAAVRLIVVTHWHDDHIRRADHLFEQCTSATLAFAGALMQDELFHGILRYPQLNRGDSTNGVQLITRLIDMDNARQLANSAAGSPTPTQIQVAAADTTLVDRPGTTTTPSAKVHALSPSSDALLHAVGQIKKTLDDAMVKQAVVIPRPRRNHVSVALNVEVGDCTVLLSGDLEHDSNPNRGWHATLNCQTAKHPAELVKVSHHGADSGHDTTAWPQLVNEDPILLAAPWRGNHGPLPTETDIARMTSDSSTVFLAAPPDKNATYRRADGRHVKAITTLPGRVSVRRKVALVPAPQTSRPTGWTWSHTEPGHQV